MDTKIKEDLFRERMKRKASLMDFTRLKEEVHELRVYCHGQLTAQVEGSFSELKVHLTKKASLDMLTKLEETVPKRIEIKEMLNSFDKLEKQVAKLQGEIKDVRYIATG